MNIGLSGDTVATTFGTPSGAATSLQSFCTVNGVPVLVSGSTVANHNLHVGATLVKPSFFFTINGAAVMVNGDVATCGDNLEASGTVQVHTN